MESNKDLIHTIPAFDISFCNGLIDWFNTIPQEHLDNEERNDLVIYDCDQHELFIDNFYTTIQKTLKKHISEYNDLYLNSDRDTQPIDIVGYKMQKSSPEHTGYNNWHTEAWPDSYKTNLEYPNIYAVWMIYLNDVEGGHTDFKHLDISLKPKAGTLVLWPAYYTHTHRANPDIRSDKYILTGWVNI